MVEQRTVGSQQEAVFRLLNGKFKMPKTKNQRSKIKNKSAIGTLHSAFKIGVMGSASDTLKESTVVELNNKAKELGQAIAAIDGAIVLTGATTGLPYLAGKFARDAGMFHIGISPAENEREHIEVYKYPTDNCDLIIYTGFGLKGRNVVLVRSCDIVLFICGSMGALNEFTIAHDEGKVIGCLLGTGGVADEARELLKIFKKKTDALIFHKEDPRLLVETCVNAIREKRQ